MADAHVLARFPAYRLGLLEPSSAQDVRDHLRVCAPCRAQFDGVTGLSEDEDLRPGHVPLGLIARWDTFLPHLHEDERTLLEEHFADCARCRDSRAFAQSVRALPERRPARFRLRWLGTGAMAMAAVLAVVFVLRERPTPRKETPARPAPAAPALPEVLRAPTLSLAGIERGGASRTVRVPKGANVLPIRVPPLLGVGPDARIDIRVDGPGGVEFGHAELAHRLLFGTSPAPSLEARAPAGALPAGLYRVHVTTAAGGAEYDFDLTSF